MEEPLRPSTRFLEALRSVAAGRHGEALFAALASELARRRTIPFAAPEPWSLASVLEVLGVDPYRADLFGAIRLLQGAQPDKAPLGYSRRAEEDPVRLEQTLLQGFANSEVDTVSDDPAGRPRLAQSALGLLGPQGPMPYRWTEHAHDLAHSEYRSQRDVSFLAWMNVMQRRQLAFFYRAWSDAQATASADRPDRPHPIGERLRALAGIALDGVRDRDHALDDFKMAFAAVLGRRVRNPGPLGAMLSRHFQVVVRIQEFVAHWLEISPDQHSRLGSRFAALGVDAVAGGRVWDSSTRFRIVAGPLAIEHYRQFLPNGEAYAQMRDLVSMYVGGEHEWELVPTLAHGDVPESRLGNPGLLLGWTSWLGERRHEEDACDLALDMAPRLGSVAGARGLAHEDQDLHMREIASYSDGKE